MNGSGIKYGRTGEKSSFNINTSGVGAGTLSITVDGPSKVDLTCNEIDCGYEVSYTPLVPGKYYVTVRYNGKNVNSSPFSVDIDGENLGRQRKNSRSSMTMETMQRTSYFRHQYSERHQSVTSENHLRGRGENRLISSNTNFGDSNAKFVGLKGSGIERASTKRRNSFYVDCGKAGNNILYVGVYGPEIPCDEVIIKHRGNKQYSVDYAVQEKGNYIIIVKYGEEHVPGSPFHVQAS